MTALSVQRASIVDLEQKILAQPQIDVPIEHYFAKGLYGRAMHVPANTLLTGKIHKTEHLCVLVQGEVVVAGEGEPFRIKAPHIFVSQPGTKRAITVIEDCIWLNVHATEETDLNKIEDELIAPNFSALEVM